jgi:ribosome-binding protein aMBF1 (putative translation factor)
MTDDDFRVFDDADDVDDEDMKDEIDFAVDDSAWSGASVDTKASATEEVGCSVSIARISETKKARVLSTATVADKIEKPSHAFRIEMAAARRKLNMTQKALASLLKKTENEIKAYEAGKAAINGPLEGKIRQVLKIRRT